MDSIHPISTEYRGTVYRSRLEARWAVFFDTLEIQHKYEPWVDEVDSWPGIIYYKPDFWLPGLNLWVEVKPVAFNKLSFGEIKKAEGWAKEYGLILILSGPPSIPTGSAKWHYLLSYNEKNERFRLTESLWWCECPKCGKVNLGNEGGLPPDCNKTCFKGPVMNLFGEEEAEFNGHLTRRLKKACHISKTYNFLRKKR